MFTPHVQYLFVKTYFYPRYRNTDVTLIFIDIECTLVSLSGSCLLHVVNISVKNKYLNNMSINPLTLDLLHPGVLHTHTYVVFSGTVLAVANFIYFAIV
jgi:hypothetical protein